VADIFDQIAAEAVGSVGARADQASGDIFDQIAKEAVGQRTSQPETSYDSTMGVLKGIAKAGTNVLVAPADLLFRGGNYLLDKATGQETNLQGSYPSDYRDQFVNWMAGGDGNKPIEDTTETIGNVAMAIAIPSQATNIASNIPLLSKFAQSGQTGSSLANLLTKVIGYGTEGAGYSALPNAKSDNLADDMTTGAALNVAIPATLKATGSLARGLKNTASEVGRRLELSAFGVGKNAINKAIKRMPDIIDETGDFQNPINDALESFQKSGGASKGMDAPELLFELDKQHNVLAKQVGSKIANAQLNQTKPIETIFTKTDEYVAGLAGTSKEEAEKIAKDEIRKTLANTDGSIRSLQDEKIKLGKAIRETAWGDDATGQQRVNILKRIRADLRETIEDNYNKFTGKPAEEIADLNREIGKRESLFPIFKDMLSSEEARTPLKATLQSLRTSGGAGQLLIAGAGYGAGGLPLGATAVGINAFLQTPTGKRALANSLRSKALSVPLQAVDEIAQAGSQPLGRVAGVLNSDVDSQETSQSVQPFQQLANTATQKEDSQLAEVPNSFFNPTSNSPTSQNDYSFMNTLFKGENMDKTQVLDEIKKDPIDHAIMLMESNGNPDAKNPTSSASGLFQLIKKTAGNLGVKDVFDPLQNYEGYKKLKAETIKATGRDDVATIYAGHYLGLGTLKKWLAGESLNQTQLKHVEDFKKLLPRLERIYKKVTGEDITKA
jgi:hypothetical protein